MVVAPLGEILFSGTKLESTGRTVFTAPCRELDERESSIKTAAVIAVFLPFSGTLYALPLAAKKTQSSAKGLLLGIAAIGTILWGAERWRMHAAKRAGISERERAVMVTRCLLGPDGLQLIRSPSAARLRLRQLAMATAAEPTLTWLDSCIPIARLLAVHATEIDYTRRPTDAPTHMREASRRLLDEMSRTGLVWRARNGDPTLDMGLVVDRLIQVNTELDLSGALNTPVDGPLAPTPQPLAEGTLVPTVGLEPTATGTPTRFFAGAPLPALTEVSLQNNQWTVRTVASAASNAWSERTSGILRIDSRLEQTEDQLTDLRLIRFNQETSTVRVTPVDDPIQGLHVILDGFTSPSGSFWLGQWTPEQGAVLSRHSTHMGWASFTLANGNPELAVRARHPVQGRSLAMNESIAIAPLDQGSVAAYTARSQSGNGQSTIFFAAALQDSDRAQITRLNSTAIGGRTPQLEFCPQTNGHPWLFVAGARDWLVLELTATGSTERFRMTAPANIGYDEELIVRCENEHAVAFGKEHARSSPVIVCDARRCEGFLPPPIHLSDTMPNYQTHTLDGRARVHTDWPLSVASVGDTTVLARAAGPMVAIATRTRRAPGWNAERVVFDAAARQEHVMVEGLSLYAHGEDLTLAIALPEGLRILRSRDRGEHWQ